MTDLARSSPSCCIHRVRWRKSRHDIADWVKPLLLDRHRRSAQARINSARTPASQEDPRTAVLLIIRGTLGARPEEVLSSVMDLVSARLQLTLHHGCPSRTLPLHHWLEIRNGGNDWIGNVRIQALLICGYLDGDRVGRGGKSWGVRQVGGRRCCSLKCHVSNRFSSFCFRTRVGEGASAALL